MSKDKKDRIKLKLSLIFSICFAVVIMATIILPNMIDLNGTPGQMHFEGNPVYFCDEAFDISSCHNKTALKTGVFSNGGHNFMETDFDIIEFANKTTENKPNYIWHEERPEWINPGCHQQLNTTETIFNCYPENNLKEIYVNATENLDIIEFASSKENVMDKIIRLQQECENKQWIFNFTMYNGTLDSWECNMPFTPIP